ncbi:MAG TPA: hypothetical protein VEG42_02620, partial [Thermoplasmata archaeon]|nr:hypothetical protein [Thermoplasmata archaeon]
MAGEVTEDGVPEPTPVVEDEGAPIPTAEQRKKRHSPFLNLGAALRKGASEPRPVKLARLGVSGQGAEREMTAVPPLSDPAMKELDLAPIRPGLSYVRITFHNTRNEYLYEVIEPPLSRIEKDLLERLRVVLVDLFEPLPEHDPETKRRELRLMVDRQLQEWELAPSPVTKGRILYYLERDFIGYGVIEVPMTDTEVEDISCDGQKIPLYIYHRKYGSIRSNMKFETA